MGLCNIFKTANAMTLAETILQSTPKDLQNLQKRMTVQF